MGTCRQKSWGMVMQPGGAAGNTLVLSAQSGYGVQADAICRVGCFRKAYATLHKPARRA
jgi:hypothetical protein